MAPYFQYFTFLPKIFLFTLLVVTCTESLLSHHDECLALYLFKQSFPHASFEAPEYQTFDSWRITNNDSDCCLWDGVVCSNEEDDGHVIGLDLSERYLRGHINSSSSLFKLVHLRTLNLAMNHFAGSQIPSQISRLKQLRNLNLSESGFSGQIPNEISHLIQLSSLDLSWNPLKLHSPSLEKLVQNLTRLEKLHLSEVDVSSSVPHFLANFSSLRSIKLRNCLLQNEFPIAIFQLPNLKFLNVASNTNLTGFLPKFHNSSLLEYLILYSTGFSGVIPKSIENLNHLIYLRLGNCSLSGIIPGSLANLTQLTYLDLGQNEFTGLVPSLASLIELTILDLSDNKFEKRCLPEWFVKLTKLNMLLVYRMNLYGEISPFLGNLTKLSIVGMGKNSLFGRIPSSFMNLSQLSKIDLSENELQGPISSSFSNFKSLQDLRLNVNNFSGRVELDWFLGLKQLKDLSIGRNKISFVASNNYTNGTLPQLDTLDLTSCNLKEYPAFLRFQRKVRILFLGKNNIHGLIPEWVWNNNQDTLEMIDLSGNFITGFHQHFPSWTHLTFVDISDNPLHGRLPIPPRTTEVYDAENSNLEGEITPLICEVKSLLLLYLSDNNITGILPPCFGSLSNSLFALELSKNNLQGNMMNSFTQDCPLRFIDLSRNQFVGQVSKSLINCTNLEVLSLEDNSLEDVFPFWLGTLVELQVLILRSNKFYGEIQGLTTVNSQFLKLRIIDLSNNGFSGQLPHKYFRSWNAMKVVPVGQSSYMQSNISLDGFVQEVGYSMTITYKNSKRKFDRILKILIAIDLSCNKFEGEIPQSLQDLHRLQSLNLSNNHFTGCISSSLGNLKNLESLDLSQNKLSREIPHQLSQLDFLAILNLSFNHLDGKIPQGSHFDTFDNSSYMGNLGLCGKPLSKECQNSKVSTVPPQTSSKSEYSFVPSERVDWIVIFCGVGSGLIVGIVFGNFLYARYNDWFIELGMTKDKWVRPLGNRRRNRAL